MSGFNVLIMSTILSLGGSFFIPRESGAQAPDGKVSFNPGEVVERVSHHPRMEGDRIVIQDRAYEAEFKEGEAVIKARQGKPGAKDLVIPVSGRPEVRDEKVVYPSWFGEVEFERGSRGLRYRERGWMPGNSLIGKGVGNFSRLERSSPLAGEFLLDTTIVYNVSPSSQEQPSLAFDGVNYLVVWHDGRSESSYDIYGARVSPSGVVLDSAGFAISTAFDDQWAPDVAFDGVNYLVVWMDRRNDPHQSYDIYGARVSPAGSVLDPDGFAISIDPSHQAFPSVAFDGVNYLVIWDDGRNTSTLSDIYGARVTPSGVVLDPAGIQIFSAPGAQWSTSVGFDGINYLVVWEDRRNEPADGGDIYAARVTPAGVVLDTSGIAISTASYEQWGPSVAFDGTDYLVAWCDYRNGSDYNIYGSRVSRGGVVLDPNGIVICNDSWYQYYPSVAFDGTNYLVAWEDYRNGGSTDIYGSRVSPGGVVLDPNGLAIAVAPSYQEYSNVYWGGTNYLVVWADARRDFWNVYGARVSSGGVVLDPSGIAIPTAANRQEYPAVAFDGTNYLVVWADARRDFWNVYGTRVSPDGRLLDPGGIAICTDTNSQGVPSVAFDGTDYLVVWSDGRGYGDIYGARVSPSGVVLDTSGIAISTAIGYQMYPSVAFDGTNYLVVWADHRVGYDSSDIYGSRVTPGGVVLDPNGIGISTTANSQNMPSVAFDGVNYLVVWQDEGIRPYYHYYIYGCRVSPAGVVLDPGGIAISTNPYFQVRPSVAFDGTNHLVVWDDGRNSNSDIYGARVSPAGIVLDTAGISITTDPNSQYNSSIAFDGTDYLVTWQDNRSGVDWDVYGAKVNPSGVIVDTFAVSLQPGDQLYPAVAHGNGSQVFVTYHGFADSINGRPANIQRIWGKLSPWSSVAEENVRPWGLGEQASLRLYPNPFREKVWISSILPSSHSQKPATLKLYDVTGRQLVDFSSRISQPGPLVWDGKDERGRRLPGGVYFVRMEHGGSTVTKKVILLR